MRKVLLSFQYYSKYIHKDVIEHPPQHPAAQMLTKEEREKQVCGFS